MKLLDLCCGAGGISEGYRRAGFDVEGVDLHDQPRYPFKFTKANVLEMELPKADIYHISPPCQLFSWGTIGARNRGKQYPDVLTPMRDKLRQTGQPFIIENVVGAPLRKDLVLCSEMFGLRVIRHRIFEIHGFTVLQPPHQKHKYFETEQDRRAYQGDGDPRHKRYANVVNQNPIHWRARKRYYATVAGHGGLRDSFSVKLEDWRQAMGIDWMNKKELTQAIPPAYSEWIGRYAMLAIAPQPTTGKDKACRLGDMKCCIN